MLIRNFLTTPLEDLAHCHEGEGVVKHVSLFGNVDFQTNIRFFNYTVLPPGTSIGLHQHGNDEELYIILQGTGRMTGEGETREVTAGDVIVNLPFGTHGLENTSSGELKILVFEVGKN